MDTCPVAAAFTASLRKLVDFSSALNEGYLPRLEALEEEVLMRHVSRATQHQRAFFCIEYSVHEVAWPSDWANHIPEMQPRSREGLTATLCWLRTAIDNLACERMEFSLLRNVVGGAELGTEQMQHSQQEKLAAIYTLTSESAVVVRRSLKNPTTRLTRVGKNFCSALICRGFSLIHIFKIAALLLAHTEADAARVWPTMTT